MPASTWTLRHHGMLDAPDAARQTHIKDSVALWHKKLNSSWDDDSIAQLHLERAVPQVAHADGGLYY